MESAGSMSDVPASIRPVTLDDLETFLELRVLMFEGLGRGGAELQASLPRMRSYFREALPSGVYRGWFAELDGRPVACIGLVPHALPPSPSNPHGKTAHLTNIVTRVEHRRRGLARQLLAHVLDIVRGEDFSLVVLHASTEGRELYEEFGFALREHAPEMTLALGQEA